MSPSNPNLDEASSDDDPMYNEVEPPIGWDGKSLQEMMAVSEEKFAQTGHYHGSDSLTMKNEDPFTYEQMYSRLRGAVVAARETALNVSNNAITREIGELCFQLYTPEGDSVAVSTGIMIHIHTGSIAIKSLINEDVEKDPGIQPGDVFCNNDPVMGNVHTADMHTMVPIFREDELIGWVDGVTHTVDIGGMHPGETLIAPTSRHNDGLHVNCEKIGQNDQLHADWKRRARRAVRLPEVWDLDEKCRLSGCHMLREIVHNIIDDIGLDQYKKLTRELIEDSRRTFQGKVKERLVPGTYRDVSFMPMPFKEEAWRPEGKKNWLNHLPVEMEIDAEGEMKVDMEGASPPGKHSYNATEASMAGGLWVSLTQSLLYTGKINDGANFGLESNFPEGSIVNTQNPELSHSNAWGTIFPTFNALFKNVSRGFLARGYREEVTAGYCRPDSFKGGGVRQSTDERFPVAPFEVSSGGLGASAIRDGVDYGYAMFNPESDMGDIESWERVETGLPYLSRSVKPNTAGHGKYRGGSGFESIRFVHDSEDLTLYKNRHPGVGFTSSGLAGGYPHAESYAVWAQDTDLTERVQDGEEYPISDHDPGTFDGNIDGDINVTESGMYFPKSFENGDIVHYQVHGAPGYGDPLERDIDLVKVDLEDDIYTQDIVEQVYGVVGSYNEEQTEFEIDHEETETRREGLYEKRRKESVSFEEFWDRERERITSGEISNQAKRMYSGVFEQSDAWADEFRSFWALEDDPDFITQEVN